MTRPSSFTALKKHAARQGLLPAVHWWFGYYVVGRLRRLGFKYYDVHYYECEIPETIKLVPPKRDVLVENITPSHVEQMGDWLPPGKAELFLKRIKQEKYGLVCLCGTEIAYFTWYTTEDEYDSSIESWIRIAPPYGYLFDSQCREEYRGLGLHTYMNGIRLQRLRQMGCSRGLVVVHTCNFSARWALAQNGFTPVKRIVSAGFGGRLLRIARRPLLLKWERNRPGCPENQENN